MGMGMGREHGEHRMLYDVDLTDHAGRVEVFRSPLCHASTDISSSDAASDHGADSICGVGGGGGGRGGGGGGGRRYGVLSHLFEGALALRVAVFGRAGLPRYDGCDGCDGCDGSGVAGGPLGSLRGDDSAVGLRSASSSSPVSVGVGEVNQLTRKVSHADAGPAAELSERFDSPPCSLLRDLLRERGAERRQSDRCGIK
jgi:hypothetical protein